MAGFSISVKRLYDPVGGNDGCRILVDRIWPRGISRENLNADLWIKDSAPSNDLRKSFNHDESRWEIFKKSYFKELDKKLKQVETEVRDAFKELDEEPEKE